MARRRATIHLLGLAGPPVAMVAAVLYLLLASTSTPYQQILVDSSWAFHYPTLDSLVRSAELIIVGTVELSESYPALRASPSPDGSITPFPFTDHVIRVEAVLKGSVNDQRITALQNGGILGGKKIVISDDPLIQSGERVILFLERYIPGSDFIGPSKNRYVILGGPQGRFLVQSGAVYSVGDLFVEARSTTLAVGGKPLSEFLRDVSALVAST